MPPHRQSSTFLLSEPAALCVHPPHCSFTPCPRRRQVTREAFRGEAVGMTWLHAMLYHAITKWVAYWEHSQVACARYDQRSHASHTYQTCRRSHGGLSSSSLLWTSGSCSCWWVGALTQAQQARPGVIRADAWGRTRLLKHEQQHEVLQPGGRVGVASMQGSQKSVHDRARHSA